MNLLSAWGSGRIMKELKTLSHGLSSADKKGIIEQKRFPVI